MRYVRRRLLQHGVNIIDVAALLAAVGMVLAINGFWRPLPSDIPHSSHLVLATVLLALVWLQSLHLTGLRVYKKLKMAQSNAGKLMICGTVLYLCALIVQILLVGHAGWQPLALAVLACGFTWAARLGYEGLISSLYTRGVHTRKVLIVGTNRRARAFAREVESDPLLAYRVVGFADDPWQGLTEFYREGGKLISGLADLPAYLRHHSVDEIVLTLPMKSGFALMAGIVACCEEQGIIVRMLLSLDITHHGDFRAELWGDNLVMGLHPGKLHGWPVLVKYVMDPIIALLCIVLLTPLFILIAIFIKIDSPGPVLFVQYRVGINKKIFRFYKFRSMVQNAEQLLPELEQHNETQGPTFKMRSDPRISRVGKFLRRWSLDELPQLFNVLNGDISLVGPRPLPLRDLKGFAKDIHRRRFAVKPGVTCLWQIRGRSQLPFEEWMRLDQEYIDNWSLLLDLKILLQTPLAVLRGRGAV